MCVLDEIVKVHFLESTILHMALGVELAGPYPSLPSFDELKQYVIDKNPRLRQKKVFNLHYDHSSLYLVDHDMSFGN